jgi:cell filamentation protein
MTKRTGRYNTTGLIEDTCEPGSRNRVLKNLLGIKRKREMDEAEAVALSRALEALLGLYDRDHHFSSADICRIHQLWLGGIYEWAGRYRQVDISKGNLRFTPPQYIEAQMEEFEREILRRYTPCTFIALEEVVTALAVVHAELVRIHPFREGNGRTARLLAIMMALQADLPILDFSTIRGKQREEYFAAVRARTLRVSGAR